MTDDEELIKEAVVDVEVPSEPKQPEEPKEAGGSKKLSSTSVTKGASSLPGILKGVTKIPKEGPGVPEDKNEPHTHLLFLLIMIVVLGVIIAFTGI